MKNLIKKFWPIGLAIIFLVTLWFGKVQASQIINGSSNATMTSSTNGNFTNITSTNSNLGQVMARSVIWDTTSTGSNLVVTSSYNLAGTGTVTGNASSSLTWSGTATYGNGVALSSVTPSTTSNTIYQLSGTPYYGVNPFLLGSGGTGTVLYTSTAGTVASSSLFTFSPSSITQQTAFSLGASTDGNFGLDIKGDLAFIGSQNSSKLFVVDVHVPSTPVTLGSVNLGGLPAGVVVDGDYAYVLNRATTGYISVVDVSKPKSPVEIASTTFGIGTTPRRLKKFGNFLYATLQGSNKVAVINVSNPLFPTLVTTVTPSLTNAFAIDIQDGYMYIGANGGVSIYDVATNPALPVEVATSSVVASSSIVLDLAATDHYLYVLPGTSGQAMTIIDISDPSVPVIVSTSTIISTQLTNHILISDKAMYIDTSGFLFLYDLSVAPTAPTKTSTTTISSLQGGTIKIKGKQLFIANSNSGPSTGYLGVYNLPGVEVLSLLAHSLEVGHAQVLGDLYVKEFVRARTGISAGDAGVYSFGPVTIGGGSAVKQVLSATSSLNFGATAAGACDLLTMTVTGAADGDVVNLGIPSALAASDNYQTINGYVSAANTITVKRCNLLNLVTALSNPAAVTVTAEVTKY